VGTTDTVDKLICAGNGKHHNAHGWIGLYATEKIKNSYLKVLHV
jgi:hypothetical protein